MSQGRNAKIEAVRAEAVKLRVRGPELVEKLVAIDRLPDDPSDLAVAARAAAAQLKTERPYLFDDEIDARQMSPEQFAALDNRMTAPIVPEVKPLKVYTRKELEAMSPSEFRELDWKLKGWSR